MVAQHGVNPLVAKYGPRLKKATEEHLMDEPEIGNMELPGGINNGVGRLVDCCFKTIEKEGKFKGELMFFVSASVLSPKQYKGLFTRVMEFMCDTPGRSRETVEAHGIWVQNFLKTLLPKEVVAANPQLFTAENMWSTAQMIQDEKPYIRFRTTQFPKQELVKKPSGYFVEAGGKPVPNGGPFKTEGYAKLKFPFIGNEPMVNHFWGGCCDWIEEKDPGKGTKDKSAATTENNGVTKTPVPVKTTTPKKPEPEPEFNEFQPPIDIDEVQTWAKAADTKKDSAAISSLNDVCSSLGIAERAEEAKTWADVVVLIQQAMQGRDSGVETEGDDGVEITGEESSSQGTPNVDDIYYFRILDKKGKPAAKATQCVVVVVDADAETCTLRNIGTKVVYPDVPFALLETSE